jgi:hypothetical protein
MVDRCNAGQADRDVNCRPIRCRHSVEQRQHDRRLGDVAKPLPGRRGVAVVFAHPNETDVCQRGRASPPDRPEARVTDSSPRTSGL